MRTRKRLLAGICASAMLLGMAALSEGIDLPGRPMQAEAVSVSSGKMQQIQASAMPYDEYERAIWYGFLTEEYAEADPDTTYLTQRVYLDMMDRMIAKLKPERLERWKNLTKDMSNRQLHRDDAMIILLFAARTLHMDVYNGIDNTRGMNGSWNLSYDYDMPGWDKPYYVSENDLIDEAFTPDDCTFSAIQFMYFRISNVTGKSLIEKRLRNGEKDGPYELDKQMTLREAVYSVLRLYESDDHVAYQVECDLFEQYKNDERIRPYIEEAEARKKAIYESPTEIVKSDTYIQGKTYTGTAYYISNDGNDANDGLTPETAWATPLRCETADLKFGDAVFFRRGDTWRGMWQGWNMANYKGITYSAYGEGAKPKIYGSPENGAGAEKWELYYQYGEKKIWKFHRKMPETGMVVFNDETYAMRATPYWDGHEFINLDAVEDLELPYTIDETTPRYDVKTDLPDMWCFPELPYEEKAWSPNMVYCSSESVWTEGLVLLEGDFFLRCDAGNPGELYDSIEFCSLTGMGGWGQHTTIDNIEVSFQSGLLTGAPDEESLGGTDVYFQNCIGRWSGTFVTDYAPADDLNRGVQGYINCGGGFFNINGPGCHATNNYCEHGFQDTPLLETFSSTQMCIDDFLIEGNVCIYCGMGCLICNYDMTTNPEHTLKDVVFNDNMYLFCGFDTLSTRDWYPDRRGINGGFGGSTLSQRFENSFAHFMSWELAHDGGLKVTNNKFIFSASQLINFRGYNEKYYSVHDGNTFAQLPGTIWLTVAELNSPMGTQMYTNPDDVFGTYIKDEHAKVIRFDTALTGSVSVSAKDPEDLSDIVITAANAAGAVFNVALNEDGSFASALPSGNYTVTVKKKGYPAMIQEITVRQDSPLSLNLELYQYGDSNKDSKVNLKDLVLLKRHLNKWGIEILLSVCDLNNDGKVNLKDLVLLQRYLNKWDIVFE